MLRSSRSSPSSLMKRNTGVIRRTGQRSTSARAAGSGPLQLAKRGWRVTGVDLVDKAMQRARERVDAAGVEVELVRGNVTALRESGVGSDFRLLLDTGTFHGLKDHERVAMGREVDAVAAPMQRCSCSRGRGVEGR